MESPTAVLACRKAVSAACVENCRGEMLVAVKEVVMIDKDGLVRIHICDEAVEGLVIWCSQRVFVASNYLFTWLNISSCNGKVFLITL